MHVVNLLTQGERIHSTRAERILAMRELEELGLHDEDIMTTLDISWFTIRRYRKVVTA